jgi:ATP-dependent RNA helicase RhlB
MTDTLLTDVTFRTFDIPESVLQGLDDAGFSRCTHIQAETLPLALAGRDVAGQAQTGTGKTAAFLVALFSHLHRHPPAQSRRPTQPRAVILAPTRELAIQIHRDAEALGKHTGYRLGLVYGGTGYEQQRQMLQDGVDILIGTPGRLIDYFKQHIFDLHAVQVMVLDEADRMFDLGFIKDIRYLLRRMPEPTERLGMLFSATLSFRVTELAYEHMNIPEPVRIEPEKVTADKVVESVYFPAMDEKIPLLLGLIDKIGPEQRSIIFVNTKRIADKIWSYLEGNGHRTAILSGDVPQKKRQHLLQMFQAGEYPFLVATDVAARGLHIPGVTHVFNYDLPQDAEDYVHRIGRTARAGAKGTAISFACEEFAFSLMDIEAYIGHKIEVVPVTPDLLAVPAPPVKIPRKPRDDRSSRGGSNGRGPRREGGAGSGPRRTRSRSPESSR